MQYIKVVTIVGTSIAEHVKLKKVVIFCSSMTSCRILVEKDLLEEIWILEGKKRCPRHSGASLFLLPVSSSMGSVAFRVTLAQPPYKNRLSERTMTLIGQFVEIDIYHDVQMFVGLVFFLIQCILNSDCI